MAHSLRIKICGITNEADASQVCLAGADAVGLNFHPASPRFIDHATADRILRVLPPFVEAVGIFVDQPLARVFTQVQNLHGLRGIQWYGQQHEMCAAYPYHYIPAFPVRDQSSLRTIQDFVDLSQSMGRAPSAILVDAHVPGQHGGTGQKVPWDLLADFQPGVPLILAGGLTPENVAEAVRRVRPFGVDVASGVERAPGQKDLDKVHRFIDNAREAALR